MFQFLRKIGRQVMALAVALGGAHAAKGPAPQVDIVYFSHTGNSRLVAERLRQKLAAQVRVTEICPCESYPPYGDELTKLAETEAADDQCRPPYRLDQDGAALEETTFSLRRFVVVVMPVWYYKIPRVVQHFLEQQAWNGQRVTLVLTHAGGPGSCREDVEAATAGAEFTGYFDLFCTAPGNGEIDTQAVDAFAAAINRQFSGEEAED